MELRKLTALLVPSLAWLASCLVGIEVSDGDNYAAWIAPGAVHLVWGDAGFTGPAA